MAQTKTFQGASAATPAVANAVLPGLQALRNVDRPRIVCRNTKALRGSVSFDTLLADLPHDDRRWDYGIGVDGGSGDDRVYWVEVHPATADRIKEVLTKLRWLKDWLRSDAPALDSLPRTFHWLASGKVYIPAGSPQYKRIRAAGLEFAGERLVVR